MANISSIASIANSANAIGGLILATPQQNLGYQPQSNPPLQLKPSILFNYEGEQTVTLESDITDHFSEDNIYLNDQIALRPEMITTHGFIGELNNVTPPVLEYLKDVVDKLLPLSAYVPELTVAALDSYNQALFFYQTAKNSLNAAVSAWETVSTLGGGTDVEGSRNPFYSNIQTQQAIYFAKFMGYWNSRTLFTVQTPWGVFKDCAIKNLRAIQDAETKEVTDFEVTFKRMRFATTTTSTTALQPQNMSGRAADAASPNQNLGKITPTEEASLSENVTKVEASG